jgi:uncharacterized membrane protein
MVRIIAVDRILPLHLIAASVCGLTSVLSQACLCVRVARVAIDTTLIILRCGLLEMIFSCG